MAKKPPKGVNPDLDKFISELMKEAMEKTGQGEGLSLLDRLRIVDRALNLEKIKAKITDEEYGSGFQTPDDEDETA